MSWNNPTPEEAEEAYAQAKSRYETAAESYLQNKKKIETYKQEYDDIYSKAMAWGLKKNKLEKKMEKLLEIKAMLEPGGAVDKAVAEVNSELRWAEDNLKKNLVCTNIQSPTVSQAFRCPTVEQHPDSLEARQLLRQVRYRYDQEIEEVESKMKTIESEADELKRKLNSYTDTQSQLSKIMKDCSYEMNHYKKYLE